MFVKLFQGAVMSAFFWGYTPAQIAGGYLSDKYGGEVVLGSTAVVWSLLTIAVPFLPSTTVVFLSPTAVMILARVCTGLSQGNHVTHALKLVSCFLFIANVGIYLL